jgi:hypothetical protein
MYMYPKRRRMVANLLCLQTLNTLFLEQLWLCVFAADWGSEHRDFVPPVVSCACISAENWFQPVVSPNPSVFLPLNKTSIWGYTLLIAGLQQSGCKARRHVSIFRMLMICISCAMDWCVCGQLQSCYLWERRPDWPWLLASPDALWWRSVKFPRRPDDLCSSITSFSGIHSWTAVSQDQRKNCVSKHAWYWNAVFLVLPAYIQNWWIVYHIIFTSHYVMFNHLLKQISVHSKKKEQISVDQLLINQLDEKDTTRQQMC